MQQQEPRFTDLVTIQRLNELHPKVSNRALRVFMTAWDEGLYFRCTCGVRTPQEQHALFEIGRGRPGKKVTNADAWQSYHNYGLAFDVGLLTKDKKTIVWKMDADQNFDEKPDWMQFVAIAKKEGFDWGGDFKSFKDAPHFEMTFGKKCSQLRDMVFARKTDKAGFVCV